MRIKVIAVVSFEMVRKGDVAEVEVTPRIEGLIKMGYLREIVDVPLPDRPSADKSRKPRSSRAGADDGFPVGDKPGEDPGTSRYGSAEGIDTPESESLG